MYIWYFFLSYTGEKPQRIIYRLKMKNLLTSFVLIMKKMDLKMMPWKKLYFDDKSLVYTKIDPKLMSTNALTFALNFVQINL